MEDVIDMAAQLLETLELQIDDCIIFAKALDRDDLEGVVNSLRQARNAVVVMRQQ